MDGQIVRRYAKALMESVGSEELDGVLTTLRALAEAFSASEAAAVVNSPLVPGKEKFALIIEPLKDALDPKLYNLLELMSEKGRLNLVPDLAEVLAFEQKKRGNRFEGIVEADTRLEADEIERLEKLLSEHSGAEVKLTQTRDDYDGVHVAVEDLGLELSLSKSRIKADLLEHIQRAL